MLSRLRTPYVLGLVITLALTVPFWIQWLDPRLNLWDVDDSKNHLIRLYHLEWLLANDVWYPRWVPEMFLGYGYPLFNYYAPAFYYLTLVLKTLTSLDSWDAFRLSGVLAVLLGASGTYALVHAIWRRTAPAIAASIFLVYAPYVFAVNLYKRGDIPEALALSLIPWLLTAIWRTWHSSPTTWWPYLAGGLGALLILTHNLTALLGALLAVILTAYFILTRWNHPAFTRTLLAGALAVGLSAFFWLPAILEASYVQLDWLKEGALDYRGWLLDLAGNTERQRAPEVLQTRTGPFALNLRYPHQLIATPKVSLGQLLIYALAVLAIATGPLLARSRRSSHTAHRLHLPLLGLLASLALLCWALTFRASQPLWDALPLLSLFQFPWRFLGLLGLCLAIAGGGALAVLSDLASRNRLGSTASLALCTLVATLVAINGFGTHSLPLMDGVDRTVSASTVLDDELRDRLGMGTTSGREFLPRTVVIEQFSRIQHRGRDVIERLYPEPEWIGGIALPIEGPLRVTALSTQPLRTTIRVENTGTTPALLGLRQAMFPGWRAWLDGSSIPLSAAPYNPEAQAAPGFIIASVPPGEHTLALAFGPTRLRLAASLITLLTVGAAALAVAGRSHPARWGALAVAGRSHPARWGALAVTLLVAYLTWRAIAPAFHRFGALPLDRSDLIVSPPDTARTGGASLSSPGGTRLGAGNPYADLRFLTLIDRSEPPRGAAGATTKEWLFLHPPSDLTVELSLPPLAPGEQLWFQSSLALDPQTWTAPFGDGVRFQLLVDSGVVLDAPINPRAQPLHRRWVPVEADLTPWAGRRIRLTLRTDPRDELSSDWSGWGAPTVYRRHSARTRPLAVAPPP